MLNRMILTALLAGILATTYGSCVELTHSKKDLRWEIETIETENKKYENDLRLLDIDDKKMKKVKKRLSSINKKLTIHTHNIELLLKSKENTRIVNNFLTSYSEIKKSDTSVHFKTRIMPYSLIFKKYDNLIASEIKETFIEKIDNDHLQFQFDDVDYQFSLKKNIEEDKIKNIFSTIFLYKDKIKDHLLYLEEMNRLNYSQIGITKNLRNIKKEELEKYNHENKISQEDLFFIANNFSKLYIKSF